MGFDFIEFVKMSRNGITEKDVKLKCIEINNKVERLNSFEEELIEKEKYVREWAVETAKEAERNAILQVKYNNLSDLVDSLELERKKLLDSISELRQQETQLKESIEDFAEYKYYKAKSKVDEIDNLSGLEFEKYCAELLSKIGYSNVSVTSGSGDQGIDVLANNGNTSYGFQCKNYSKVVGNKAVQEVISGKAFYNLDRVGVITNNFFTTSAKNLAELSGVELWDRGTLKSLIEEIES